MLRVFSTDPAQIWSAPVFKRANRGNEAGNLRADVALVLRIDAAAGADAKPGATMVSIHVIPASGEISGLVYGSFDGVATRTRRRRNRNGNKIGHVAAMFIYMCPARITVMILSVRGRSARADERGGSHSIGGAGVLGSRQLSGGFKREWQNYYGEAWQPPHSSVKMMPNGAVPNSNISHARALQQVFDSCAGLQYRTAGG